MRFDLVAEDKVGAGIAGAGGGELVAQRGQGLGAPGSGQRVEPDEQDARSGMDVAGGGEGVGPERPHARRADQLRGGERSEPPLTA